MKPATTGARHIIEATRYSMRGLRAAWRNESAFRQESTLALILCPCAFLLGTSGSEIALLIVPLALVLVAELLNSALEAAVDRAGGEWNELAGRAKDMGSAAVFVTLVLVPIVWGLVAWSRFG